MVMSWPHSGQLFFVRLLRLYLHFLQCVSEDIFLPMRALMRRASAMVVVMARMVSICVCVIGVVSLVGYLVGYIGAV